MKTFDITKCPKNEHGHLMCQTLDGRSVRIICTDSKYPGKPLVALIESNFTCCIFYGLDGKFNLSNSDNQNDLINLPVKREGWVNIYEGDADKVEKNVAIAANIFVSQQMADSLALKGRVACVRVEWEE